MMRNTRSLATAVALLACSILPLANLGCVASRVHTQVPAFAQAVSFTAGNVREALDTVETSYEEAQTARLVLDYDTRGFDSHSIHPLLSPAAIDARLALLDALSQYATTLAEVTGDAKPETAPDAGSFLQNLSSPRTLQQSFPKSKLDLNIAATAIDTLSHWLIERKRRQKLPEIVGRMQPAVQTMCDLLVEDMGQPPDAQNKNGHGLRDLLWHEFTRAMDDQQLLIQESKLDIGQRAAEIRKLPEMVRRRKQADRLLEQIQAALRKIAETHAQIAKSSQEKETLRRGIMDLAAEAQRVKDDYDALSRK